jgi:hypothetical protein
VAFSSVAGSRIYPASIPVEAIVPREVTNCTPRLASHARASLPRVIVLAVAAPSPDAGVPDPNAWRAFSAGIPGVGVFELAFNGTLRASKALGAGNRMETGAPPASRRWLVGWPRPRRLGGA